MRDRGDSVFTQIQYIRGQSGFKYNLDTSKKRGVHNSGGSLVVRQVERRRAGIWMAGMIWREDCILKLLNKTVYTLGVQQYLRSYNSGFFMDKMKV